MSSHPTATDTPSARKAMTLHRLREMRVKGEKITMLTCYDASFARLLDGCELDCLLVGDSLGMVLQGQSSTVPVNLDEMVYHTRCVARGNRHAWLLSDLPFGSYQESLDQCMRSSVALMQAGAQMIKLEGGGWTTEAVRFLTQRGIPVCAHLGLTPQSVHALGGYRVQGRDADGAATLRQHARELSDAGATMLVLELVPTALAAEITAANPQLITVGIGAGNVTAAQVLVLHDMLGITAGKLPRFVRNFMQTDGVASIEQALRLFVSEVKSGRFPDNAQHGF